MAYQRKTRDIWVLTWHSQYGKEEVDQFDTYKEAREMAREYRLAFGEGSITVHTRRERLEPQES